VLEITVLILTLNDTDVPPAVQRMISGSQLEINTDDASKIIGTINALSKQFIGDNGVTKETDPTPMKRAVAFCSTISDSKKIAGSYNDANEAYLSQLPAEQSREMVTTEARHMDGTMDAPTRDQMLSWLKESTPDNECRIITNVRVLSEGVDVPSLDSVLFLSARNSPIDVVQSVGRVMRRAEGKKYGYIIIPVIVPSDVEPEVALDDNERYKVVWTVLNALRAHDDRFNATVNKIDLNRKKPDNILIGRPDYTFDEDGKPLLVREDEGKYTSTALSRQLALQFEDLQSVIYARMVEKVGERRYWEQWAKDVAVLAERQIERITSLVQRKSDQRAAFDKFVKGLRKNLNPSITDDAAIEMLAQHIITKPIFEALFEEYSFEKNNVVSVAMQNMLTKLEGKTVAEESDTLQKFYDSVRKRAEGIDNAEGKQKIIIELYDTFFKMAFPKMAEQLGIVYTPIEVVDFIVNSVDAVLKKEFDRGISDENVHILDPFVGTGTFITRLLQSGIIEKADLKRKYNYELHANELVLLAYYIAAVNIENVFHDLVGEDSGYKPFEGIVLTDTFQLGESDGVLISETLRLNSERVERQKKAPLTVIMGNPPYSAGQTSANDDAKNQEYGKLESRIRETYAEGSNSTSVKDLYDSYFKAFRWASDRLSEEGGIVAYITNSGWIDKGFAKGFRDTISEEFSKIYVINLRGAIKGRIREGARREGGNVFDIQTGVAITILVKQPTKTGNAEIYYAEMKDYITKEEKLSLLEQAKSKPLESFDWSQIKPNEYGDWINQRSDIFQELISLAPNRKFDVHATSFFVVNSLGLNTNRDVWVYNFSEQAIKDNVKQMIACYNDQVELVKSNRSLPPEEVISYDSTKISWSSSLLSNLRRGKKAKFDSGEIRTALYRPFVKNKLYFGEMLIHRRGQFDDLFPTKDSTNLVILSPGKSGRREYSALITNSIVDLNIFDGGVQCFPLYYYEECGQNLSLFDLPSGEEFVRRDGISHFILGQVRGLYGNRVTKEDIFFYVYGLLHSVDFRTKFSTDLQKMLARIPLVENARDFRKISKAGRELASLHIDYEAVPPYQGVRLEGEEHGHFIVEKVRFKRVREKVDGKTRTVNDRCTIHYNSSITISNIPEKAYEYVINGRSAIEWIMDRYQIRTDKKSGITNDPNDWAEEVGNPRYILDLLLSVINVSVQTVDIVENLPKLEFE